MKFNAAFVFFKSFSAKHEKKKKKKKRQRKRNDYSVIEQNALSGNYMEYILKGSHPKMTGQNDRQDESLTGQVHDQSRHCPLTGRCFEPCTSKSSISIFRQNIIILKDSVDDLQQRPQSYLKKKKQKKMETTCIKKQ